MRKGLFVAVAIVSLALAPASFAQSADASAGTMGNANAMAHDCTNGKDAMGHACKPGAMKHDAMSHDTMGHDTMAHDTMGHDTMGHDTMGHGTTDAD